jgi:hypothetical protein
MTRPAVFRREPAAAVRAFVASELRAVAQRGPIEPKLALVLADLLELGVDRFDDGPHPLGSQPDATR